MRGDEGEPAPGAAWLIGTLALAVFAAIALFTVC